MIYSIPKRHKTTKTTLQRLVMVQSGRGVCRFARASSSLRTWRTWLSTVR